MTAYWIARVRVSDADAYGEYAKRAGPAIEQYQGRFLACGGACVTLEGAEFPRNVIIAFPTLEQATACYNSDEYQEAWAFQKDAAIREVCIVEGI